ncbi:MAG: hypothetical protein H6713_38175 [Myxococcales bacterium]|nr:hypothetical protein [Myxococcales bacterium]
MPSTTRPDAPRARARALPPPIHAPSPTVATLSSLLLISALACGGDDGVADTDGITTAGSSDPSAGPTDASATGSSGDDSAASMTDGASDSSSAPKLDTQPPDGTDSGGAADECTNVDILFVIDDSASMGDNQVSLINSFAGFVAGIKQQLSLAESYHVGVVTSDAYGYNAPGCRSIGDLVTQTGGADSSEADCAPFSSGKRYLDDSEPNLTEKFACAARVGSWGSDDEMMMRAMLDALKPGKNAPGECNDGFSRLDSLLVIVLITDEDDVPENCDVNMMFCDSYGSGGDKQAWYDELSNYRVNLAENVVVLSLFGKGPVSECGAVINSKIFGFTNLFDDNGYTGDVCSESYDEFFAAALPIIDQACENFVPPT